MIRQIKNDVVWFLQEGPQGTENFFNHHRQRQFIHQNLKVKIKSVKLYLDMALNLIQEDLIDYRFIENIKFICQCALLGSTHLDDEQEKEIPQIIKNNWMYILMWIAKDICLRQEDIRSTSNAVRAIECKIFFIFDKITSYRINLQVRKFLVLFRKF